MRRRTFLTTAGVTLATVSVAGCSEDLGLDGDDADATTTLGNETDGPETTGVEEPIDPLQIEGRVDDVEEGLELVEWSVYETSDGVGVIGAVTNVSGQRLEWIEVEVTLLDGDTLIGEVVDTSEEELEGLAPGDTWRFQVTFPDEDLDRTTNFQIDVEGEPE